MLIHCVELCVACTLIEGNRVKGIKKRDSIVQRIEKNVYLSPGPINFLKCAGSLAVY